MKMIDEELQKDINLLKSWASLFWVFVSISPILLLLEWESYDTWVNVLATIEIILSLVFIFYIWFFMCKKRS